MTNSFRKIIQLTFIVFFLVTTVFCLGINFAHAQNAGVGIKPAQIDEALDPGFVDSHTISVTNLNPYEETFYVFLRDISGVDHGGVPIFAKENSEKSGYELSDWITVSSTEITIPAGESRTIDLTLSVPDNASPGSHFGGLFFSVDPPDIEVSGAAVAYQVVSTIHVRVSGEIVQKASIRQFSTGKFLYGSQNVDFSVRIENGGNVLIKPTGPLEIKNMLGKEVATLTFNEDLKGVFPNDTRDFSNIVWEGDSIGFGRYEAMLSPVYGEQGVRDTMTSTVSFWILPMNIIGPALLALLFILLVTFFFVRLYIRRSLEHLNHGRRMVKRHRRRNSSSTLLLFVVLLTVTALFLIVLLALFA